LVAAAGNQVHELENIDGMGISGSRDYGEVGDCAARYRAANRMRRRGGNDSVRSRLLVTMPPNPAHGPPSTRVRNAEPGDIAALVDLEHRVFATDRLSRRSLQRFLRSNTAQVIVADEGGRLAAAAVVLFRPRSTVARLYSIAVTPQMTGRGIGPRLLEAAEDAALARNCGSMRLEVHETNHAAISRYRKSGYREFGRHPNYYDDGGDALRFEKNLAGRVTGPGRKP
jgi:ribosomal protein S18 acetylase RimI-like enzyme